MFSLCTVSNPIPHRAVEQMWQICVGLRKENVPEGVG